MAKVNVDKNTRRGALLIGIAARLARWIMMALGATWKTRVVVGQEHLDALLVDPRAVILSFWHNRVFLSGPFVYQRLLSEGLQLTLLASQSRDGELVTKVCERWGVHTVRGSASRGGLQAMRAIHRAIKRQGSSPIMIPDGPRGPLYYFKPGVVILAQMSQAPILPYGIAARSYWTLKSWDRIVIPKPFTQVAVVIGEPQQVARQLNEDELEAERQRLEALLNELTRQAEQAVAG